MLTPVQKSRLYFGKEASNTENVSTKIDSDVYKFGLNKLEKLSESSIYNDAMSGLNARTNKVMASLKKEGLFNSERSYKPSDYEEYDNKYLLNDDFFADRMRDAWNNATTENEFNKNSKLLITRRNKAAVGRLGEKYNELYDSIASARAASSEEATNSIYTKSVTRGASPVQSLLYRVAGMHNEAVAANNVGRMTDLVTRSEDGWDKLVELTGESAGVMIPGIAIGALSIATGGAAASLSIGLSSAYIGMLEGNSHYIDRTQQGVSHERALAESMVLGTVNAAIEQYLGGAGKYIPGIKSVGKSMFSKELKRQASQVAMSKLGMAKKLTWQTVKNAVTEGVEEVTQGLTSHAVSGGDTLPRDENGKIDFSQMADQAGKEFMGGVVGALTWGQAGNAMGSSRLIKEWNDTPLSRQLFNQVRKGEGRDMAPTGDPMLMKGWNELESQTGDNRKVTFSTPEEAKQFAWNLSEHIKNQQKQNPNISPFEINVNGVNVEVTAFNDRVNEAKDTQASIEITDSLTKEAMTRAYNELSSPEVEAELSRIEKQHGPEKAKDIREKTYRRLIYQNLEIMNDPIEAVKEYVPGAKLHDAGESEVSGKKRSHFVLETPGGKKFYLRPSDLKERNAKGLYTGLRHKVKYNNGTEIVEEKLPTIDFDPDTATISTIPHELDHHYFLKGLTDQQRAQVMKIADVKNAAPQEALAQIAESRALARVGNEESSQRFLDFLAKAENFFRRKHSSMWTQRRIYNLKSMDFIDAITNKSKQNLKEADKNLLESGKLAFGYMTESETNEVFQDAVDKFEAGETIDAGVSQKITEAMNQATEAQQGIIDQLLADLEVMDKKKKKAAPDQEQVNPEVDTETGEIVNAKVAEDTPSIFDLDNDTIRRLDLAERETGGDLSWIYSSGNPADFKENKLSGLSADKIKTKYSQSAVALTKSQGKADDRFKFEQLLKDLPGSLMALQRAAHAEVVKIAHISNLKRNITSKLSPKDQAGLEASKNKLRKLRETMESISKNAEIIEQSLAYADKQANNTDEKLANKPDAKTVPVGDDLIDTSENRKKNERLLKLSDVLGKVDGISRKRLLELTYSISKVKKVADGTYMISIDSAGLTPEQKSSQLSEVVFGLKELADRSDAPISKVYVKDDHVFLEPGTRFASILDNAGLLQKNKSDKSNKNVKAFEKRQAYVDQLHGTSIRFSEKLKANGFDIDVIKSQYVEEYLRSIESRDVTGTDRAYAEKMENIAGHIRARLEDGKIDEAIDFIPKDYLPNDFSRNRLPAFNIADGVRDRVFADPDNRKSFERFDESVMEGQFGRVIDAATDDMNNIMERATGTRLWPYILDLSGKQDAVAVDAVTSRPMEFLEAGSADEIIDFITEQLNDAKENVTMRAATAIFDAMARAHKNLKVSKSKTAYDNLRKKPVPAYYKRAVPTGRGFIKENIRERVFGVDTRWTGRNETGGNTYEIYVTDAKNKRISLGTSDSPSTVFTDDRLLRLIETLGISRVNNNMLYDQLAIERKAIAQGQALIRQIDKALNQDSTNRVLLDKFRNELVENNVGIQKKINRLETAERSGSAMDFLVEEDSLPQQHTQDELGFLTENKSDKIAETDEENRHLVQSDMFDAGFTVNRVGNDRVGYDLSTMSGEDVLSSLLSMINKSFYGGTEEIRANAKGKTDVLETEAVWRNPQIFDKLGNDGVSRKQMIYDTIYSSIMELSERYADKSGSFLPETFVSSVFQSLFPASTSMIDAHIEANITSEREGKCRALLTEAMKFNMTLASNKNLIAEFKKYKRNADIKDKLDGTEKQFNEYDYSNAKLGATTTGDRGAIAKGINNPGSAFSHLVAERPEILSRAKQLHPDSDVASGLYPSVLSFHTDWVANKERLFNILKLNEMADSFKTELTAAANHMIENDPELLTTVTDARNFHLARTVFGDKTIKRILGAETYLQAAENAKGFQDTLMRYENSEFLDNARIIDDLHNEGAIDAAEYGERKNKITSQIDAKIAKRRQKLDWARTVLQEDARSRQLSAKERASVKGMAKRAQAYIDTGSKAEYTRRIEEIGRLAGLPLEEAKGKIAAQLRNNPQLADRFNLKKTASGWDMTSVLDAARNSDLGMLQKSDTGYQRGQLVSEQMKDAWDQWASIEQQGVIKAEQMANTLRDSINEVFKNNKKLFKSFYSQYNIDQNTYTFGATLWLLRQGNLSEVVQAESRLMDEYNRLSQEDHKGIEKARLRRLKSFTEAIGAANEIDAAAPDTVGRAVRNILENVYRPMMEKVNQFGVDNSLIGYDMETGEIYQTNPFHVSMKYRVDTGQTPEYIRFNPEFKGNIDRQFKGGACEAFLDAGLELENDDFTYLFKEYVKGMYSSLADRTFIELGKKTGLLSTEQRMGDEKLNHPNAKYRGKTLYAPKEISDAFNKITKNSFVRQSKPLSAILDLNSVLKSLQITMGTFHHWAFARSFVLGGYGYNLVKAYKSGRDAMINNNDIIKKAVNYGAFTDFQIQDYDPNAIYRYHFLTRWMYSDDDNVLIENFGKAARGFLEARNYMQTILFPRLGAYLKRQAFIVEVTRSMKPVINAYTSREISAEEFANQEKEIYMAAGKLIDRDFGGLNQKREKLGNNFIDVMKLSFLGPDWTASNFLAACQPFSKNKTEARIARHFWARVITQLAVANVLGNLLMSLFDDRGFLERYRDAWELGNLRWLGVDISPIYHALGGDDSIHKYSPVAGHMADPLKWLTNPVNSMVYKSSPVLRPVLKGIKGSNYKGERFTSLWEIPKMGTVDWNTNTKKGPVRLSQLPSWALDSAFNSTTPFIMRPVLGRLAGELDTFDTILDLSGYGSQTSYK